MKEVNVKKKQKRRRLKRNTYFVASIALPYFTVSLHTVASR